MMLESRKPTEQELNEKRDYIVLETCHERYSFETCLRVYSNTSLQEIIDDNWNIDDRYVKVWREDDHSYTCEMSCHNKLDTKYSYPDLDGNKLQHIHLDTVFIFDMQTFLKEGYQSYIWGSTENKFGLIDIKREESE